jgi:S1-C subfamily serine protease
MSIEREHTMHKFVALFFASIVVIQSHASGAIEHTYSQVGGWQISYKDEEGGCSAFAKYPGDTTTVVMIKLGDTKTGAFIGFGDTGWNWVRADSDHQITLRTEPYGTWPVRAWGANDGSLGMLFIFGQDNNAQFWMDLRRARNVVVQRGNQALVNLRLTGSDAAILAIRECLERRPRPQIVDDRPPPRPDAAQPKKRATFFGTGFFVSKEGNVVTNNHVVNECSTVRVALINEEFQTARVVATDARNDLALLKADIHVNAVPPIRSNVRMGESIAVYGFPLVGLLPSSGNFTIGYVTALEGLNADIREFQMQAPIQPGNSGGPVMDYFGNIVGVATAKLDEIKVAAETKNTPQLVNYSIKSLFVVAFLESHGVEPTASPSTSELSPAQIAERAKSFTVRVRGSDCPAD